MTDSSPYAARPANEAELISEIVRACAKSGLSLDVSDDCGYWSGGTDLVTTDTIVEGRHFDRMWDLPWQIGRQAAVVNLSDVASSGGRPRWAVWSLVLNSTWSTSDIFELTRGFAEVLAEHDCRIIGGNLAQSTGPSSISVTVGGTLLGPSVLRRDGAQPGDQVYLSGCLGTSAMGYLAPGKETRSLRHTWRPHLSEARDLASYGCVTACMDISDGLLLDAHRLSEASGVRLDLERDLIPIHPQFGAQVGRNDAALRGGEDYVLLFTASPESEPPNWATRIGYCGVGHGVFLDDQPIEPLGHDHFVEELQ